MSIESLTFEKVWQMFQETDKKFRETDRQFKETDRQFKDTDKKFKETDKKLRSLESLFTGQWGKLMESLVEGELVPMLNQRGIMVNRTFERVKGSLGSENFEFDLIAENGLEVVIVEVKTTLKPRHVESFLQKLARLDEFLPRYVQNKVYGAVAYLRSESDAHTYSIKNGLFVIRATGNSASIINSAKFQPVNFGQTPTE